MRDARLDLSLPELVALIAGLMALNALAIDIMLPALPNMGAELGVTDPNHRQYVVIAYLFGVGFAQLLFGPASDRFGRRGPLLVSLVGYSVFGVGCIFSSTFELLVVARALQGIFAAGARAISLSIVRDAYKGRGMARVMSLVMMVFMIVPILAPNVGQLVLLFAPWQWIFGVLVLVGLAMTAWVALRLSETLPPEKRRPIDPAGLAEAYGIVLRTRTTVGYTLAAGVIFGALFSFISSAEQLFSDVFDRRSTFTLYFAGAAGFMAVAALLNSRLVARFGMRRLSHTALLALIAVNLYHVVMLHLGRAGFFTFYATIAATWFCFSFIGANFNAMAMEPLGEVAGTASAFLGFTSTIVASLLGAFIGQRFDGTVVPLATGFMWLGAATLGIVLVTERGRLFQDPEEPAPVSRSSLG